MDKIIFNYNHIVYTHDGDIIFIKSWADLEYIKNIYQITDIGQNINFILNFFNNTGLIIPPNNLNIFYISQLKIYKKNNSAILNNWINYKCKINAYNMVRIKNINDEFSPLEDIIYIINNNINDNNIKIILNNFNKRLSSKHFENTDEYYYELHINYNK